MEKRRAISHQKHVEKTVRAGEKEAERAGVHALVEGWWGGGGGKSKSEVYRHKLR